MFVSRVTQNTAANQSRRLLIGWLAAVPACKVFVALAVTLNRNRNRPIQGDRVMGNLEFTFLARWRPCAPRHTGGNSHLFTCLMFRYPGRYTHLITKQYSVFPMANEVLLDSMGESPFHTRLQANYPLKYTAQSVFSQLSIRRQVISLDTAVRSVPLQRLLYVLLFWAPDVSRC